MFKLLFLFFFLGFVGAFLWVFLDSFYWFFKFPKFPQEPIKYKVGGFFYKIFVLLPYMIGYDRSQFDVNSFNAHGLIIFEGKQGTGKTISMIRYANLLKARFPESIVVSNTKTIFNDIDLYSWQPLVNVNNGRYGVICLLDEISIWFSNRNYKNFPPELLQVITQNRKNRRVILGTAQNITMVDKAIRLQSTCIVKCYTFGPVTFNFWSVPEFDSEGNILKRRFKKFDWFVQDRFLRESYDTYSVIESLSRTGFKDREES